MLIAAFLHPAVETMHYTSLLSFFLLLAFCALFSPVIGSARADVDVVVVGGGLSGLSTAKDLAAANKTFVVLEARDTVGGRVRNFNLTNGGEVELGAEFVGPTQDRVLALAAELGLETFLIYDTGDNILYRNGKVTPFAGDLATGLPPVQPLDLIEVGISEFTLDQWASQIDVYAPWTHPRAEEWDSQTLQDFTNVYGPGPDAQFLLDLMATSVFSTNMHEPSMLWVLAYIASAGNQTEVGTLERLTGVKNAAQESRIVGGTQLLAIELANKLGWDNIKLNQPVEKVILEPQQDVYIVETPLQNFSAEHVVIAMAPPMAARIEYDPPVPAARDQLTQRMPMGAIGKAIAIYETPFWRDMGLNGQVLSDAGAMRSTFDSSPPDGSFGAMMGFLEADVVRQLDELTIPEIETITTQDLVNYFGPQAANVSQWVIQRWDLEEYSRGGPVAYAPPGVLTEYGAEGLRAPFGKLHFAGTETAPYWTGYMDGAIRSGERAAAEIISNF